MTMMQSNQRISDEKLNQFALTEFGTLPTTGPTPAEVYNEDETLSMEQRFANISEKCYGQRCDLEEAGYIVSRLEFFLKNGRLPNANEK